MSAAETCVRKDAFGQARKAFAEEVFRRAGGAQSQPVLRVFTTSTGKQVPPDTVIVGPRDFNPEG